MERAHWSDALYQSLSLLARTPRYHRWMLSFFRPYIGKRVLDAGCGIGNMVEAFRTAELVVGIDVLVDMLDTADRRWGHLPHVRFQLADITQEHTVDQLASYRFDTVALINVLEHVADDDQALKHTAALLQPGGHALIYVPASPRLFNRMDEALGHYRRYTSEQLLHKIRQAGLRPLFCTPLNTLGLVAWWFDGRIRKHCWIPAWQVALFDMLVPILRPTEGVMRRVWPTMPGLSLACVARKEG